MAAADHHEVELKLIAADAAPLEQLAAARRLGPAGLGPPRTVEETDRYLDTRDGRFAEARWACRLRTREGRTIVSLKGPRDPAASGSALHRRPEVEGPATDRLDPSGWPPSDARALAVRLAEGRPLVVRFTLLQRRTERRVEVDGERVGLLTLDRVDVRHDGRSHGELLVVELELAAGSGGDAALIASLDAELRKIEGLVPDQRTKLERAGELIAASPGVATDTGGARSTT